MNGKLVLILVTIYKHLPINTFLKISLNCQVEYYTWQSGYVHTNFFTKRVVMTADMRCTSHPFDMKPWPRVGLLPIHLRWCRLSWINLGCLRLSPLPNWLKIKTYGVHIISMLLCWMMRCTLVCNNRLPP